MLNIKIRKIKYFCFKIEKLKLDIFKIGKKITFKFFFFTGGPYVQYLESRHYKNAPLDHNIIA